MYYQGLYGVTGAQMVTATDVANYFIDVFKDNPVTQLRVMKFVYYAQGHALARLDRPLFNEDIQAWEHGPVVKSAYKTLSPNGNKKIMSPIGNYSAGVFSEDEIRILRSVAMTYGKFSTADLISMCHEMNGPWSKVYSDTRMNVVIPNESIKKHFEMNEKLDEFDMEHVLKHMKAAGPSDSEGNTILPADYDDY